jgi:hypothetical protein
MRKNQTCEPQNLNQGDNPFTVSVFYILSEGKSPTRLLLAVKQTERETYY